MSPPPLDDDDLSADLDGEASDEIREQVAADPDAQARQASLRDAVTAVGRPVPPLDDDVVDALVSQALAAHDESVDQGDAANGDVATPIPLPPRRRGRSTGGGARRWLVAAVVVVLAAIGLGLIRNGLDESRRSDTAATDTATQSERSASSESGGDASAGEAGDAATDDTTTTGLDHGAGISEQPPATVDRFTSLPELGSYASEAALRRALRTAIPAGRPTTSDDETLAAANRCAVTVENQMDSDRAGTAATATLDGRSVLIYELRAAPPGTSEPVDLVVAVDREACTPAFSFYRDR